VAQRIQQVAKQWQAFYHLPCPNIIGCRRVALLIMLPFSEALGLWSAAKVAPVVITPTALMTVSDLMTARVLEPVI
jgi:hypothetical protein